MVKTTIDGLAVRKSGQAKKVTSSSSHRVVGGTLVEKSTTTRRSKTITMSSPQSSGSTRSNSRRSRATSTDFLDPVRGFDYDDIDNSLGVPEESDWSELLNSFNDEAPRKTKRSNSSRTSKANRRSKSSDLGLDRGSLLFDDEVSDEPKKSKPKKPKKKRKHHIVRNIFLCLLLLLVGGGIAIFIWGDSLISRLTNGQSGFWDTVGSLFSEEVPFETDSNGRTNILVFGTEGYDMDGPCL